MIGPSGSYDVVLPLYLVLNQYAGPMRSKLVRQAVATAVNKQVIVQLSGGPRLNSISNQMILPGNIGYVKDFNAYPANPGAGNPVASKALLKMAGYANGLAIKLLTPTNDPTPRLAQALQSSLNAGGFKVEIIPVTQSDFYGKYMYVPSTAKRDVWDVALSAWAPDWFGNNGRSVLQPLFTAPGPGSANFGGYNSPVTNRLIESALTAKSQDTAAKFWTQANVRIMKDAGAIPIIASKVVIFNSSRVQGCNFFFWTLSCDLTSIWLQ